MLLNLDLLYYWDKWYQVLCILHGWKPLLLDRDYEEIIRSGTHVLLSGPHKPPIISVWCPTNLFGVLLQSPYPLKFLCLMHLVLRYPPIFQVNHFLDLLLGGHVGLALVSKKLYRLAKVHEAHSFIPGFGGWWFRWMFQTGSLLCKSLGSFF